MLLENKYYEIENIETTTSGGIFHIKLIKECDVYNGHFPGNPVCPGVCNIETVKECAIHLTNKNLSINTIQKCRFTAVATPYECPEMDVIINIQPSDNGFTVTAKIKGQEKTYMEFKGFMTV